jgi:hypothetical protein
MDSQFVLARVLAHCGGDPTAAVGYVAGAIARDPVAAEPAGRSASLEPEEIDTRAAAAAYRARVTGAAADRERFTGLLGLMPESSYKDQLAAVVQD